MANNILLSSNSNLNLVDGLDATNTNLYLNLGSNPTIDVDGDEAENGEGQLDLNQKGSPLSMSTTPNDPMGERKRVRDQLLKESLSINDVDTNKKKKAIEMLQAHILLSSASPSALPSSHPHNKVHDTRGREMLRRQFLYGERGGIPSLNFPILNGGDNTNNKNLIVTPFNLSTHHQAMFTGLGERSNNYPPVGHDLQNRNNDLAANRVAILSDDVTNDKDDGQIHSLPHQKNGPYTCPRCNQQFLTSQRFAAHVSSSHYKYETQAERRKRLMAKVRKRNLRLEKVNERLTLVPDSSVPTGNDSSVGRFAQGGEGLAVARVEQVGDIPRNEAHGGGFSGVRIKLEPDA